MKSLITRIRGRGRARIISADGRRRSRTSPRRCRRASLHGFGHPLGGLDHVLAMVAVGLYAALLGGRALWLVPATFVAMMAVGGALRGMAGYHAPLRRSRHGRCSVVALGVAVALHVSLSTLAAMALAGVFALFHGHAHGAEMPQDLSGYEYAAGFLLATALLHGAGASRLGWARPSFANAAAWRAAQFAGGAMALAGVALLTSAV